MSISKIKQKLGLLAYMSFYFVSNNLSNSYFLMLMFIANSAGTQYGISRMQKLDLVRKVRKNTKIIKSLSSWQQHLLLIEEIFQVPKSLGGDVIECGCYEGASTANLSLACALTNRKLIVCDSFEGLPKPRDDEKYVIHADSTDYYVWEEGEFSANLDNVKRNVERFGNINVCQFVKGYFADTLKNINTDAIVLVFEDADMASSVEDCLRYLWPRLQEGCKFYSHEPWSIDVVSLFYDKKWWWDNLKMKPPGFWGSGYGTATGRSYSMLGYSKKFNAESIKKSGKKVVHLGSKGFEIE